MAKLWPRSHFAPPREIPSTIPANVGVLKTNRAKRLFFNMFFTKILHPEATSPEVLGGIARKTVLRQTLAAKARHLGNNRFIRLERQTAEAGLQPARDRNRTMKDRTKLKARWFETVLREAEATTVRMPWQRRRQTTSSSQRANPATEKPEPVRA